MTSTVSLPDNVGPGTVVCDLALSNEDARQFVDRLKVAVDRLIAQRASGSSTVPSSSAALAAPPPAAQLAAPAPLPALPAAAAASAAPTPAPAATRAPPPLFPGAVPATAPQPPRQPAAAAAQASAAAPPRQQVQQAAQPPAQQLQRPAPTPSGGLHAAGSTAAGQTWQLCYTTDAAEHSSDAVSSMVYVPQIEGLPGGDGHAGWLISSSRGLLNLWEASPSGGRGEPALMCMHSQGTDYTSVCLDADRPSRMLVGASADRGGAEWVSCFSLDVETLLAPKGRCPMPHTAASRVAGQNCLAVASLSSFGGPLAETCVASYGGALVVWHVGSASRPAASNGAQAGGGTPKALWKAHDALITTLHKSPFGLALFSGDATGKVHMYNMREKPSRPQAQFTQEGRITGIHQINDTQLLTTGGDGRLMVWDVRSAAVPVKFAVPDGRPIVRVALSPFADSAAVATTGGIHMVDLLDTACTSTPVATALKSPVTSLLWNAATSEVVVAGGAAGPGSISVFKARLGA